ncbi:hypothetical protein B0H14DRAFT_2595782 [Mycena olivaceomarginata]|nr:hypothetical protein B0H14DRAFT_2595782 [Mycena olivaceomarginata]
MVPPLPPAAVTKAPTAAKAAAPAPKATVSSGAKATVVPAARPAAAPAAAAKPIAPLPLQPPPPLRQPQPSPPPRTPLPLLPPLRRWLPCLPLHPKAPRWPPPVLPVPVTPAHAVIVPAASSTPRDGAHSPGPDFPPVSTPSDAPPKSHAQKRKESKGKGKSTVPRAPTPPPRWISPIQSDDEDFLGEGCTSYDLDADLNRAVQMSVGQTTNMDTGASSSRRAATHAVVNGPPVSPNQWDEVPQPKVVATISGGNGDRIQTAELVRTNIADRFNAPHTSLLVGTLGLAENNGPDPIAWLIAGISDVQAQALIDMGCLCSDTLTMFFHEYHPPISGFMGTWQGFTMAESDAELAHRIIVDAALADPAITRFVRAHRDSFPTDMTADKCPRALRGTHHHAVHQPPFPKRPIRCLECLHQVCVDLPPLHACLCFDRSPTNDEESFNTLHGLFQRLIIDTPFHGQGHIYTHPLHCNICLSVDHPTNLCLLPSIPGWLGPTPETIGALLDATREVLNPRAKKSGSRPRDDKSKGKGKGKDRDDHKGGLKGGDRRCGN